MDCDVLGPTGVYTQCCPMTVLATPEACQLLTCHGPDVCRTVASEDKSHQSAT